MVKKGTGALNMSKTPKGLLISSINRIRDQQRKGGPVFHYQTTYFTSKPPRLDEKWVSVIAKTCEFKKYGYFRCS